MRVALVHDWLVSQRGGENVLVELAEMFPEAPIYTLVHQPGSVDPCLERRQIFTSFIQDLPGAPSSFRRYLPLFPAAVERWDLSGYDLIVSTSHCVAKGVITGARQTHVAYVHTPMRYLWDQMPHYLPGGPIRPWLVPLARALSTPLRRWDVASGQRPDLLVANSRFVAQRIAKTWGRQALHVYPPVDVEFFAQTPRINRDGLLVVSALVPYKRVELAVRAANAERWALHVIGDGPEFDRLRSLAGPTVTLSGAATRAELREAYGRAEALLFCGEEDFGIVPVEAMAAGCPVVALGSGGALETVVDSETGVFFDEPEVEQLIDATRRLRASIQAGQMTETRIRQHAQTFAPARFRESMHAAVRDAFAKIVTTVT